MGFSHVSKPIRMVTGKTFARKFITLGRVINYWADAVGPELAAKTYPIGMKVRKVTKAAKPQGTSGPSSKVPSELQATLEIAASSADATLIHYQKGLILERLRTLLAADMIVDIRVTHAAQRIITPSAGTGPSGLTRGPQDARDLRAKPEGLVTNTSVLDNLTKDPDLNAALSSFAQAMSNPVNPLPVV